MTTCRYRASNRTRIRTRTRRSTTTAGPRKTPATPGSTRSGDHGPGPAAGLRRGEIQPALLPGVRHQPVHGGRRPPGQRAGCGARVRVLRPVAAVPAGRRDGHLPGLPDGVRLRAAGRLDRMAEPGRRHARRPAGRPVRHLRPGPPRHRTGDRIMTSTYAWLITTDLLAEPGAEPGSIAENAATVSGPRDAPEEMLARLRAGEGERFLIRDDDQEPYYEGLFLGDPESEDGFGPLDDF